MSDPSPNPAADSAAEERRAQRERLLDQALADSFPASDPISFIGTPDDPAD